MVLFTHRNMKLSRTAFHPVSLPVTCFLLLSAVICYGEALNDKMPATAADAVPLLQTDGVKPSQFGADYLIGPGDILDISVWKDEALTRSVVVLPDGRISFPLAGELVAAGRSVSELKKDIAARLDKFVPELVLSIEVKQSNSMLVYVIGRVNAPGRQVLNANIDVLQALAMAGGLNPFAGKDRIRIFRRENGSTAIIPFRYSEVVDGTRLSDNIELRRGDVIVVP